MVSFTVPQIYFPKNLSDILTLYQQKQNACIFAGGTALGRDQGNRFFSFPESVISIQNVEELKKISRTEKRIDIGAGVTIKRILEIGKHIIPQALYECLQSIAPPGIKQRATIGGNICLTKGSSTTIPLIHCMDVQLELRRHGKTRWIAGNRWRNPKGELALSNEEILTRIRIPLGKWNYQCFRKIGIQDICEMASLNFCGLVSTQKEVLSDLRIAFSTHNQCIIRAKESEANLVGRKIPLPHREIQAYIQGLAEIWNNTDNKESIHSSYLISTIKKVTYQFLMNIGRNTYTSF